MCPPWLSLLIIPILLTTSVASNPKQSVEQEIISYRLPNETYPVHYDVYLTTNIHEANFNFTGRVEITIATREETSVITVHARQLIIGGVRLLSLNSNVEIALHPYEYDDLTEFVTIRVLDGVLLRNQNFLLIIEYVGELREDNLGFYRSSYRDADNQLVWLAATQFAATNARHAWPCYDEPHMKATYEIYITHDTSYTALSNYPLFETIENDDGSITSHFCSCNIHQSIQFSSYIVGFVVAKFDYIYSTNEDGIEFRVYSRPEAINNTRYALNLVDELLKVIQDTVKVEYVLPKLYQVALPDFYFNAMENWGLITYKEERLLFDEESAPYTYRIENSRTMAHEVAHKWFGNYVTHNWWSFVWFKEGFARFFEQYAFGKIRPEWRIEDLFVLTDVQNVLFTDSLFTTRQMTQYKESPSDILALYDNVAYQKGGSFLRMFYNVLGDEPFFNAVTELLNTALYTTLALTKASLNKLRVVQREQSNAVCLEYALKTTGQDTLKFRATNEDELFEIFANVTGELNLVDILRSWTHQAGYPVINVDRNFENGTFTLTQRKFNMMPEDDLESVDASWSIPYNFFTDLNSTTIIVNERHFPREAKQIIEPWSSNEWIILNYQQTGFYRVNYDEANWNLIISELNDGDYQKIPVLNRAQLIDDAFNLARANQLSYKIPFRLIEYLKVETDFIPWMTTFNALSHIDRFYVSSENYQLFRSIFIALTQTLYERVYLEDVTDEPIFNKYARTLLINWGCELDLSWCHSFVNEKIYRYAVDGIAIEPNLRSAVYCSAVRIDSYYFSQLYSDLVATKDQTERKLIINALGCTNHTTALESKLLTIFNNTDFRHQEITPYFTSVYSGGRLGMLAAIKSIRSLLTRYSVDDINKRITGIGGIVLGMAQRINTEELDEEFTLLLTQLTNRGIISSSTVVTAKKYMKMNSDWLEYSDMAIKEYLYDHYGINSGAAELKYILFVLVSALGLHAML